MSPILTGVIASGISGHLTPPWSPEGAYDSLASTTLSSTTSTITFSGIPSGYKHLQLRWIAQTNRGTYGFDDLWVRFNGDSSALYSTHILYGNGASAATGADSSATYTNIINSAGTTTSGSWWGTAILDVLDYGSSSKFKTMRALNGIDLNGNAIGGLNGRVNLASGSYQSLNPVTSITITSGASASFLSNTSFALYGIK